MRLHEEYVRRHGLGHVPLVRYDTQGAIILRTTGATRTWLVVTIKWVDGGVHPGVYVVDFYTPVHNGHVKGRLFQKQKAEELEWDEFEDYFLDWSGSIPAMPAAVDGDRNRVLTAWEIFVYIYDGWFATQTPELRGYVDHALDTDLEIGERYVGYQNCLIYLTARHPGVLKAWRHDVLSLSDHYSGWLAALVRNCGASQITTSQEVV